MMPLANRLRMLRLHYRWTQQQLADEMGMSKNNISQYELGRRDPSVRHLIKFAEVFNVSVDELLGSTELWLSYPMAIRSEKWRM